MSKDTPSESRPPRVRGKNANHGDAPDLKSYLSTLFYLASVPATLGLAYFGHLQGLYPYPYVIPAFAGLFLAALAVVFGLMHVLT